MDSEVSANSGGGTMKAIGEDPNVIGGANSGYGSNPSGGTNSGYGFNAVGGANSEDGSCGSPYSNIPKGPKPPTCGKRGVEGKEGKRRTASALEKWLTLTRQQTNQ